MEAWIIFTLMAAFMQSIRTAGQKKLSMFLSPMATTLVRYLFGVPIAIVYLSMVMDGNIKGSLPSFPSLPEFYTYASLGSIAQILATFFLVKAMALRNFAVATIFSKTEVIQTAIFGVIFFSAFLSWYAWLAVLLAVLGIVVLSAPVRGTPIEGRGIAYGLLSGVCFAFTALWLRQASISLSFSFIQNAAYTLAYTVVVQTIVCLIYITLRDVNQFKKIRQQLPLAIFVGASSALGSIGWYTAMTYENAALVRSLGQIEILFSVLITHFIFREKITLKEYFGLAAIALSVLILLLVV
mgnify:CR=1 FL=1